METISSHYYDIVYKISSLTGMWPYLKPKTRTLRVALLTIVLLTILLPQVRVSCATYVDVFIDYDYKPINLLRNETCNRYFFQIAYQFMCNRNLHCTFQAMTAYLLSAVALLKVYTFQFNTRTVRFVIIRYYMYNPIIFLRCI